MNDTNTFIGNNDVSSRLEILEARFDQFKDVFNDNNTAIKECLKLLDERTSSSMLSAKLIDYISETLGNESKKITEMLLTIINTLKEFRPKRLDPNL